MKKTVIILLTFCFTLTSCQHITTKKFKKMKIFNKEFIIPDIDKDSEILSTSEIKTFENKRKLALDKTIIKSKEMEESKFAENIRDTLQVDLKMYNSQTNETLKYFFNNQTKEFGILTYYDSDPLLQNEFAQEQYFEAQPMKYELYKGYYPNGSIKIKQLLYSNIFIKKYEYDEKGNLTKSYEHSKKYRLSIMVVLQILERNNVEINFRIDRLSTTPSIYLSCMETNRGKIWHLEQYENEKEYIIFDETGELLSQKRFSIEKGGFSVLSRPTYIMRYGTKTIEEVEREMGLKLFVVGN